MDMKPYMNLIATTVLSLAVSACSQGKKQVDMDVYEKGTFGYDLGYLGAKDSLVVLTDEGENAQVIVSPKYQAKVFTSTVDGWAGTSLGYLNYDALDAETINEHMNGYGGENRFWIGPEGGQYSVFFEPGAEQVYDHWHTPKAIDVEPWEVVASDRRSVRMSKEMEVQNYRGTELCLAIDREIRLLEPAEVKQMLGVEPGGGIKTVAYATRNSIRNRNDFAWTEQTGTICMWMLDMFNVAPGALTIVPFVEGPEDRLGKIATTDYFGEIPADRIRIEEGVLYLKTDGKYRSKLGVNPKRTKAVAANYNPGLKCLTVTTFDVDPDAVYLNQEWNPAKNPLIGDALNAYNDGPLDDGSIMGPFLEVESASPAAFLKPGEQQVHRHNVFHFVGEETALDAVSRSVLGVTLSKINSIF